MAKKKTPTKKPAEEEEGRARVPEWAKGLTALQRRFVEEYGRDWNATRAAKAAGYSEKTARQQGARLLSNVVIQAAIQQRLSELALGPDEVLARVAIMARGTLYPFLKFKENGDFDVSISSEDAIAALPTLKTIQVDRKIGKTTVDYDDMGRATIRSIEDERIKVELHDQMRALELLGRAHGLWEKPEKREEQTHEVVKAQLIERLMELPDEEFAAMMPLVRKLQALLGPKSDGQT
jgi:phage terminase small subunit